MALDIRTIMVMFAVLTFMFSGLLALAGIHAENVKGIRQWAVANLCIGLGLSFSYFYNTPSPEYRWVIVIASTLLVTGISLQFTGIQAFTGKRSNWYIALLIVGAVFLNNIWFAVLSPDYAARAVGNSLIIAMVYLACARALLIRIELPLKTAYWFTGISFAVLAAVALIRAVLIWRMPQASFSLFENTPVNPFSFFIACMVQLCVTFGFILMLDYRLVADLQKIASLDILTGALNRRRLDEEGNRLWARSRRTGDVLAIMMIDVDHFKSVNDRYGHPAGDEVLRRLALIAQASIRVDDYFARYGGEEFCILLPSTTEKEAFPLAERLCEIFSALSIEFNGTTIASTISVGVADSTQAGLDFSSLVAAADAALYRAKQQGRNRVVSRSAIS